MNKSASHAALGSAFYIISRTVLFAGMWLLVFSKPGHSGGGQTFLPGFSANDLGFSLFVGWLFALVAWRVRGSREGG